MGRLRKKVNELLDQKRLGMAIALALCISVAVSAVKFWDWFKYRIGLITAMLAMFSLNEWAVIIGIHHMHGELVLRKEKIPLTSWG